MMKTIKDERRRSEGFRLIEKGSVITMDRSRHFPKLCFFISIAVTLAAVICRTVAMFVAYDAPVGYFDETPLTAILTALNVAGVVLPLVVCVLIPKDAIPATRPVATDRYVGWIPVISFAAGAVAIAPVALQATAPLTPWLLVFLCIPCALYFALSRCPVSRAHTGLVALLGFTPIVWSLIALSETYLDPLVTINSPVKLSLQAGLAGLMLLATAELRVHLERRAPRWELALRAVSAFLCLNGSVATLIACFSGIVTAPLYAGYTAVLVGAGIYAALHTAIHLFSPAPTPSEEAPVTPEAIAVEAIPSNQDDGDAQPPVARGDA